MESTLRRGAGDPALKLIETLGWDGLQFNRLELHLARLQASARRLDWACDVAKVQIGLVSAVAHRPLRVRLTLDQRGEIEVTVAAMPTSVSVWKIGLSDNRLASTDPWLGLKSTRRAAYDSARANLPLGIDEVVFQNERGEVCDGSITTVFFDRGDGMCTPPLACGLLPGVFRAEMLARGDASEDVLRANELGHVRLWVGNSLRGLIPAYFS